MNEKHKEYLEKEAEFAARTDALCNDVSPFDCDCSKCPCHDLCAWLDANNPYPINNR